MNLHLPALPAGVVLQPSSYRLEGIADHDVDVLTHPNPLTAPSCLPAAHQQLAFRVCRCADSILSAGTRRRFRTSLSFDSVQMSHLVGSNCHGFTPLR